jgi:hypothetical protein
VERSFGVDGRVDGMGWDGPRWEVSPESGFEAGFGTRLRESSFTDEGPPSINSLRWETGSDSKVRFRRCQV